MTWNIRGGLTVEEPEFAFSQQNECSCSARDNKNKGIKQIHDYTITCSKVSVNMRGASRVADCIEQNVEIMLFVILERVIKLSLYASEFKGDILIW